MTEYLALDWEQSRLSAVEGRVFKGRVDVDRCWTLAWPEELLTANPEQAGEWLKDRLQELGVKANQALVALPREDVVARHLELPQAPPEEIPDLVRFQAAARSAMDLNQLMLDYVPLVPRAEVTGLEVFLSTVPTQAVDRVRALLAAAGIELVSLGISPVAAAELVARVEGLSDDSSDVSLAIVSSGDRVEISAIHCGRVLFAHSTRLSGGTAAQHRQAIAAEISRASVALQPLVPQGSIRRAWILGTADPDLGELVQRRLGCEVGTINPLEVGGVSIREADLPEDRAALTAPVGLLLSQSEPLAETIDFLNPHRPPVVRDYRKLKSGLIAAGVVLVAAMGYFFINSRVAALDDDIAAKRKQADDLEQLIERMQPAVDSANVLEDWVSHEVNWLDRMNELAGQMQGTERHYLTALKFDPARGQSVGKITGDGVARDRADVYSLYTTIGKEPDTEVRTHEIPRGSSDGEYPYKFQLDVDLKRPAKAATEGQTSDRDAAVDARRRGGTT